MCGALVVCRDREVINQAASLGLNLSVMHIGRQKDSCRQHDRTYLIYIDSLIVEIIPPEASTIRTVDDSKSRLNGLGHDNG